MSSDERIEEGEAIRVDAPAASGRGVRARLTNLSDRDDPHARMHHAARAGPEGGLGGLQTIPLVAAVEASRRWHHRRRLGKAMAVLFPKERRGPVLACPN